MVVVRGRVQGVFFRDGTRRLAADTGVTGWVGNEPDGSVRAVLEGEQPHVEQLIAWMHEGPREAVVEDVEVTETELSGHRRFDVR